MKTLRVPGSVLLRHIILLTLFVAGPLLASANLATAEVRFGNNVRIGGNDVSGQTFNRKRRGLFILHDRKPANEGCRWRANRDGSRTKVCNLQRR
jgi:hypothetical protein